MQNFDPIHIHVRLDNLHNRLQKLEAELAEILPRLRAMFSGEIAGTGEATKLPEGALQPKNPDVV